MIRNTRSEFIEFKMEPTRAPRRCFNIQSFVGDAVALQSNFSEIVLTSNKVRASGYTPLKRLALGDRENANPAKRLRTDNKLSRDPANSPPSCSLFVETVQSYIRSVTNDICLSEKKARAQLEALESQYLLDQRSCDSALHLLAKLESCFLMSKRKLSKQICDLKNSSALKIAREIGYHYILCYQETGISDEERIALFSDFRGRYLPSDSEGIPVHQCNTMMCQRCNIPMYIRNEDGFLVCKTCCTTEAHSERIPYIGLNNIDDADSTALATKKVSNFRDYLHLLQGKKLNPKLEQDITAMQEYIQARGILQRDVTSNFISTMLVHLGKRKYMKYLALLESRLCGTPLIQMTLQQENKFCSNFLMLVDPYERHKPPSRKHFMSYAYAAWQFCRIENTPEFYNLFRLLKDPSKIAKQDEIFLKICPEIGWTFEPSCRFYRA